MVQKSPYLTRRRVLASGAAISTAAVAGCIGGDGDDGQGNIIDPSEYDYDREEPDDEEAARQSTMEYTQELERDEDFDPIHSNDAYSTQVYQLVFDSLYDWDDGLTLEPKVAVDMPDVERDDTRYIYEIHEGIEFHNGEEMTASDVAHSFMAFQEEDSVNEAQYDMIESAEVIDDYQVQVDLEHPYGQWELQTMAISVVPESERETESDREEFNTNPVGSGPFVWSDFEYNEYVTLERNDDYWDDPEPYLEEITFVDNVDDASRISEIRADDTDAIAAVPNDDWSELEGDDDIRVHISESPSYMHLTFNCRGSAPTSDPDVRRGICHAFSMTDFVETHMNNTAQPLAAPIPPITNEQWNFPIDEWREEYYPEYDPDRAEELLDGAVPDDWNPSVLAPGDVRGDLAERIVTRLDELGYDAEAQTLDFGTLLDRTVYNEDPSPDDFQAYILGWTGGPDPDAYLYNLYHESQVGVNQAHFYEGSDSFHDDIAKAREMADQDERYDLYEGVMIEILEELPSLPAYSEHNTMASRRYVKDLHAHPEVQSNPRIVSGYGNVWTDN
ncbi:ABC transporter substrate-binding protein [Halopiger djelfimassiliensis]|uniref:ABC transporter substrate-binding protein n=1 Tax=Halopiger djelfimassiliensis TaxID=1293047 RepID=UPI000677BDDB|nr:ABC transporter substrate-binding protein [Halopiger djelfimassiliensis]